jgi:hypothetical protein
MRVQFSVDGGVGFFPGLQAPTVIDSAALSKEDAATLHRLVSEADIFAFSRSDDDQPTGADRRRYTIEVEHEGTTHTAHVADPITDPAMRALVAFLRAMAKKLRAAERTT